MAQSPNILVSSQKFDAKSVADVIARARAAPGTLNVATGATMHLLNAAMFKSMANLTWVDVPYKGSGPALNDLISGHVDLMFDQLPSSLAQVQGGRLRAVAVTSRTRTSVAPDIPLRDNSAWFDALHSETQNLMNSMHASFIRHHIRAMTPDFDRRLAMVRQDVDDVMKRFSSEPGLEQPTLS